MNMLRHRTHRGFTVVLGLTLVLWMAHGASARAQPRKRSTSVDHSRKSDGA